MVGCPLGTSDLQVGDEGALRTHLVFENADGHLVVGLDCGDSGGRGHAWGVAIQNAAGQRAHICGNVTRVTRHT